MPSTSRSFSAGKRRTEVAVTLACAEVLPSENAVWATAFFRRAVRWFESLGIRCQRVLSEGAKCYESKAFTDLCQRNPIPE